MPRDRGSPEIKSVMHRRIGLENVKKKQTVDVKSVNCELQCGQVDEVDADEEDSDGVVVASAGRAGAASDGFGGSCTVTTGDLILPMMPDGVLEFLKEIQDRGNDQKWLLWSLKMG